MENKREYKETNLKKQHRSAWEFISWQLYQHRFLLFTPVFMSVIP